MKNKFPKANLTQEVRIINLTTDKMDIHTSVSICNIGDITISIRSAQYTIYRVLPLDDKILRELEGESEGCLYDASNKEINWTGYTSYINWRRPVEIEPDEIDIIHFDLVVPAAIDVFIAYTYFRNEAKAGDIGWSVETLVER